MAANDVTNTFEVTLSGPDGLAELRLIGISIFSGIAQIPHLEISVDHSHLALLCDLQNKIPQFRTRAKMVSVQVAYKGECKFKFKGFITGISINQFVGALSCKIIIRSEFILLEDFVLFSEALHIGSDNPLTFVPLIKSGISTQAPYSYVLADIDPAANVVDIALKNYKTLLELTAAEQHAGVKEVIMDSASLALFWKLREKKVASILSFDLLGRINTSAVEDMVIKGNTLGIANFIIQHTNDLPKFSMLRQFSTLLSQFGLTFSISNNTLYVIPDHGFLKLTPPAAPQSRETSKKINVAYPADYNGFSFSADALNELSSVVLTPTEGTWKGNTSVGGEAFKSFRGKHPNNKDVKPQELNGTMLIRNIPADWFVGIVMHFNSVDQEDAATGSGENTSGVSASECHPSAFLPDERQEAENALRALDTFDQTKIDLDNLASIYFFREKFAGRTGSFTTEFNTKFVPGAQGSLFLKYPNTRVDFRVTGVSHQIEISAPLTGSAITTVSVDNVRFGTEGFGVKEDNFSKYNSDKHTKFLEAYYADLGSTPT
jgi:hypothetical protein